MHSWWLGGDRKTRQTDLWMKHNNKKVYNLVATQNGDTPALYQFHSKKCDSRTLSLWREAHFQSKPISLQWLHKITTSVCRSCRSVVKVVLSWHDWHDTTCLMYMCVLSGWEFVLLERLVSWPMPSQHFTLWWRCIVCENFFSSITLQNYWLTIFEA